MARYWHNPEKSLRPKSNEELEKKLKIYQQLADENAEIICMLQKDKDFIDWKAMAIEELINNCILCRAYKEVLLELVKQIRGKI